MRFPTLALGSERAHSLSIADRTLGRRRLRDASVRSRLCCGVLSMLNLNDPHQSILSMERARNIVNETRARIEETEHAIQQTRALIEQTRSSNAAIASLAQAIDSIGKAEDPRLNNLG